MTRAPFLLFLLAFGLRLAMLAAFPGLHGDDAAARLAYSDHLLLAYQLPLPQLLVAVVRRLAPDPFWTQLAFSTVGATVAPLLAAVVARLESEDAGRLAGLLAAVHPLLVYYSMVPYQEGPMLALLLAGALALLRGQEGRGAVFLGLAAGCRYEAWIALAIVIARRRSLRRALPFVWAPLCWIAAWRGLSPAGTYVLDLDPAAGRLPRLGFLVQKTADYSGEVAMLIAAAGAAAVLYRGDRRWRTAAGFAGGVVLAVILAGHEFPPGSGRVSERLAHLPVLGLCAAAGAGLSRFASGSAPRTLAALALVTLVSASWVRQARVVVAEARRDPGWRLAREVADFVEPQLGAAGRLCVAAPSVPAAAIEDYVRKVEKAGGDVVRARETAHLFARLPPDAVRVAAHLARPPGAVVPSTEPAALAAVFDGTAAPPGIWLASFEAGRHRAAVYALPHRPRPR